MSFTMLMPEFRIERDQERCIACQVCVRQCANDIHDYDADEDWVYSDYSRCVGCHRCVTLCPTGALTVRQNPLDFRPNANWTGSRLRDIYKQAETGGILLSGMGCDQAQTIYFDHLLLNASQVTNPSIDPLREPMELRTYIGRKPDRIEVSQGPDGLRLETQMSPQLVLETPIMFSAMSYGSISYNAWTPKLLKAGYNYQYSQKDPGAYVHNFRYVVQAMYDSIQDLGGSVQGMTRP